MGAAVAAVAAHDGWVDVVADGARIAHPHVQGLPRSAPTRVVVGEAEPLVREGIVHVLQASGFDVVATSGDAADLVRKARAHSPDVAVVGVELPPYLGDDGLHAAREILTFEPQIAVLVLSHAVDDRHATDLLDGRIEGIGYLLRHRIADVGSFVDAVRRVARGGSVIDAEIVGRLVGRRLGRDPVDDLTLRERDVLDLMAQGRSNQGIADGLVVTVSAVERHVTSIFSKFGLTRDRHEHPRVLAVLRYLEH
jgi:DNA-binding NarL/FixJ family response regulator